jgi:ferredoxin
MNESRPAMHYVCTHPEAQALVRGRREFWVSNCGCREGRGGCARSRADVCLMFADVPASGSGKRPASAAEVAEIFREAARARLVTRPFRDEARTAVEGICFCCDDCCGYFRDPGERCDPGPSIEETTREACTDCGLCAPACYFGARAMAAGGLLVDRLRCYGCGLCADVCPEDCIAMVPRRA